MTQTTNQNNETQGLSEENITTEEENSELTVEEQLKQALKEAEEKYLRALAELENSRRMHEKMRAEAIKYAVADFAKETLVMADVFAKAFAGIKEEEITDQTFQNFLTGIKMTHKELEKILDKFGIEKISPLGEKFDANYHEALFAVPDPSKEDNTIYQVIEDGYTLNGRLLRSAKVGIVKN